MKTFPWLFAVVLLLSGCSADPQVIKNQIPETETADAGDVRIKWLDAPGEVGVGDRVLFSVSVTGDVDTGVLWSSSPDTTAVDRAGTFRASRAGTYHVLAASRKDPSVFVESTIRVFPIIHAPYALSLTYGETVTLTATVPGVDNPTITWQAAALPTGTTFSSRVIHAGNQSGHFRVIGSLAGWSVTHTVEVSVSETHLWWWMISGPWNGSYRESVLGNVVATKDGGFAVAGTVNPRSSYASGWIAKFDSGGRLIWQKGGLPALAKTAEVNDLLCVRAHCLNTQTGNPVTSFSVPQLSLLGTAEKELILQGHDAVQPYLAFLEVTSGTLRKFGVDVEFQAGQLRTDGNILLYNGDTIALMTVTGTTLWARQWSSGAAFFVSPSGQSIYRLVGGTQGNRLTRIDENGNPVWTKSFAFKAGRRQSGCTLSSGSVASLTAGMVRDDGSITVIGHYSDSCTSGPWIAEVETGGEIQWQRAMTSYSWIDEATLLELPNKDYIIVSTDPPRPRDWYPDPYSGKHNVFNIHPGGLNVPKPGTWIWNTGFSTIDATGDASMVVTLAVEGQGELSMQGSAFTPFAPGIYLSDRREDDDGQLW